MFGPFRTIRLSTVALIILIIIGIFGAALPIIAAPLLNNAFTYQGQIATAAGAIDGSCDLRFSLFDAETGGEPLGTGMQSLASVPVSGGVFTVLLDFGPGVFPGAGRFLELAVRCPAGSGDFATLAPRQPFTPAPYAITSQNTQAIQQRPVAADAPAVGQVLMWDGASWRPALVPTSAPTVTGGISGVTTGSGLSGGGTSGNVGISLAEPYRLPQNCALGQIAAWSSNGWVCANFPQYTAGNGLMLAGGAFAVDPQTFQRRVVSACAAGTSLRAINQDGSVVCEPFSATSYTAGAGLQLNGTAFAADPAFLQRRVSSACAAGSSIRTIAADGGVICQPDTKNPGTISNVTAGLGLSGGGITGTVALAVDSNYLQRRVVASCAAGSSIRLIAADGAVVCDAPADTIAGVGLERAGNELHVGPSYQLPQSCDDDQRPSWNVARGQWQCAADSNTTYGAGTGMSLASGQFHVAPSYQLPQACADGQRPDWDAATKAWQCATPITGVLSGTGLVGGGTAGNVVVAADPTYLQRRVVGTCTTGAAAVGVGQDGSVACSTVAPAAGTGITTSGQQVNLAGTYRLPQGCGAAQIPGWDTAAGSWKCANAATNPGTITGVAAGTGMTGGGTSGTVTLASDTSYMQRRVTGACVAGSSIRAIYSDGTVVCESDTDTNSGGTITGVAAGPGLVGGGTSGMVTLALADNALDLVARQGSNGTNWNAGGTTNYPNPKAKMQAGAVDVTLPASATVTSITIAFPQAFAGSPLVMQGIAASNGQGNPQAVITALSGTSVTFEAAGASGRTYTIHWFAVGS